MKRINLMKRIFTLLIAICISSLPLLAQNDNREAGRLEAFKIAYLTKKLNLSPEEAQRFWPLYNRYQGELRSARISNKQGKANEIELEEKVLGIRKKYNEQFSKALSDEKVNQLYKSEKEFGAMVQKELMERRQERINNRKKNN